ncbi:MAG: class I SAM-dependent methyltransferase [Thermoguttaceae bacterium]|nr:class I SAM-dependent methyltransferase [Thermoguttaceae bacterium]
MTRIIHANWYDFPQYYDLAFRDETRAEAAFLQAAFTRYADGRVTTLLEPACGSGRLVRALAAKGFRVLAFDLNQRALVYCQRRLQARGLRATLFRADMCQFAVSQPVDAAFCTFDSFRHLLTEKHALQHLRCMAEAIRPGGVYILGVHLLPPDASDECVERWRARHGRLSLAVTLRVLKVDRRRRREWLRVSLRVQSARRVVRIRHEFPLRIYTASQLRKTIGRCGQFDLCDTFDYWYEIDRPSQFNDDMADTVLVLRRKSR